MEKKVPQHCSKYWGCSTEETGKCPACTAVPAVNCWSFAEPLIPKKKREFKYCIECPWFKLHHQ